MVILKPKDVSQVKTIKQQALITRLLQSSYFSKREFIELMKRNRNQIITSYDASVLIGYVIASLRFRKKFLSKKHKAHLKCDICSSRKLITRSFNITYNAQALQCLKCEEKELEHQQEQEVLGEKNRQRLRDQGVLVHDPDHATEEIYAKAEYQKPDEYDAIAHNPNSPQNKPSALQ